ncbi:Ras association domain-containing protein 2 [Geodia barretti]|nr:Ras association domain-containing protein 2 [Geodia barretti]
MVRLRLGPSEDIAKLYIMEKSDARAAQISAEVAEWIKFSLTELELFCKKYEEEEKKEVEKVIQRYLPLKDLVWEQLHALEAQHGTPNGTKPVYVETDV